MLHVMYYSVKPYQCYEPLVITLRGTYLIIFTYLCAAAKLVVASAEGFREFGDCAGFTDHNHATCEAVTSSDNPLGSAFRANLSNYFANFESLKLFR